MKKLLVVLLTLSLVIGMFSFAAFADQGSNSGNSNANSSANSKKDKNNEDNQGNGSTVHVIPSMDFNANAVNAFLNKDAALDRSTGNTEDNSDKVWSSYLKEFKHSPDNKNNPKLSSKLSFTELIKLRKEANENWDTINGLNKDIKKAFDKFRASLKGLTKDAANLAMEEMKQELSVDRAEIAASHGLIKGYRLAKDAQWKLFRAAVKAGYPILAQTILDTKIVVLKQKIVDEQEKIIAAKTSIRAILGFTPGKVPAVPTFSPEAGPVLTGTYATIKSPGAEIYFTTQSGITVTTAPGFKYTGKFLLTAPVTTVRAIAYRNGVTSTTGTAVYLVQDYAIAPKDFAVTVTIPGSVTMKPIAGPAAGATTKAAITGWVKDGTFSFSFIDDALTTPSAITINGKSYVNGAAYPFGDHDPYHHVVIVVKTSQKDRITAVRTFIIDFKKP